MTPPNSFALPFSEVVTTLVEAIVMVFLIIFLFLQNFRATFIPTIVVPVALLGTFGVMYALGFSINVLTMFGMVLAMGVLVDDAIVVVENVERIMSEEGLSPRDATHQGDGANHRRAHRHFAGADGGVHPDGLLRRLGRRDLPPIFAVADFVHVVFHFPGDVADAGVVRLVAQAGGKGTSPAEGGIFRLVQPRFRRHPEQLRGIAGQDASTRRRGMWSFIWRLSRQWAGFMYRLPSSFLPDEDQGYFITLIQLPVGATQERTVAVLKQVEQLLFETDRKWRAWWTWPVSALTARDKTPRSPSCI